MILTPLPTEFEQAKPIIETIEAAGYEAYFVGGSVRDTILGKPIHDVDIATSAFPAEVKGLFKRTVDTGIEHGTVMILDHGNGYETTTFRTESGYQDFRRPDQVCISWTFGSATQKSCDFASQSSEQIFFTLKTVLIYHHVAGPRLLSCQVLTADDTEANRVGR